MIADLKPYPEYKESGLPWLGKIPIHWEIKRCKSVFQRIDQRSQTGNEELLTVSSARGIVPRKSASVTMFKAESYVGYKLCWPGDLVINSLWAWAGGVGVSNYHGIISTAYGVYRIRRGASIIPAFINEVVRSVPYNWEFRVRSRGVWISRLQITDISFFDAPIFMPRLDEQLVIVRFLDWANGRLERAIRAKRKVVALLNEQKQAIIHQVVTRGLDPSVPVKDSGVPWLGEIPAHWEIRRNASLFFERREAGDPTWPILTVSLRTGVTIMDEETDEGRPRRLIAERSTYQKATAGDIAYNMMRAWQGALGVSPVDGLVSPAYVVAAPRTTANSHFYAYVFRTEMYKGEINRVSTGIVSDRNRLYWEHFKSIASMAPSVLEQREIVTFLDRELAVIDEAIGRAKREIELLNEYRTRLTADVVTGKLDVREFAASLPESIDGEESESDDVSLEDEEAVDD